MCTLLLLSLIHIQMCIRDRHNPPCFSVLFRAGNHPYISRCLHLEPSAHLLLLLTLLLFPPLQIDFLWRFVVVFLQIKVIRYNKLYSVHIVARFPCILEGWNSLREDPCCAHFKLKGNVYIMLTTYVYRKSTEAYTPVHLITFSRFRTRNSVRLSRITLIHVLLHVSCSYLNRFRSFYNFVGISLLLFLINQCVHFSVVEHVFISIVNIFLFAIQAVVIRKYIEDVFDGLGYPGV